MNVTLSWLHSNNKGDEGQGPVDTHYLTKRSMEGKILVVQKNAHDIFVYKALKESSSQVKK